MNLWIESAYRRIQWDSELPQEKEQDHTANGEKELRMKTPFYVCLYVFVVFLGELLDQFNCSRNSLSQRHQTI